MSHISVLCLLLSLVHIVDSTDGDVLCPCEIDVSTETAHCNARNLTKVPECLPVVIKSLELHRNNFVELRQREFAKFKELEKIELGINKLQYVNVGCFQGLNKLVMLSLRFNNLQIINGGSFHDVRNLKFLYLTRNKLKYLSDLTFMANPKLHTLDLIDNKITHVGEHAFAGLSMLKVLSLAGNSLYFKDSLPLNVFSPLISLDLLQLNDVCKQYSNCTYFDQQISRAPSLKKLCLTGLQNQVLGSGFQQLKNLEEVYFGYSPYAPYYTACELGEINSTIFDNLRHSPLTKLSLYHCFISHIKPYTFAQLKTLRALQLRENPEVQCHYSLEGITSNIKSLDLAGTSNSIFDLGTVHKDLSDTKLEHLDLSHNHVTGIAIETPRNFWMTLPKSLKHLYLHNNKMSAINVDLYHITDMDNLLTLDLSNQKIHATDYSLNNTSGASHDSKIRKDLEVFLANRSTDNKKESHHTSQMDQASSNTTEGKGSKCLSLSLKLRSLNISRSNLLPIFIPLLCTSNNSLTILNISNHKTSTDVEPLWGVMKNVGQLEEVDLNSNKIKEIPAQLFSNHKQLRRLWLSDNSLVTVDLDLKSSLHLSLIDLSYNSILYVSNAFTSSIDKIARQTNINIYFQNNSFLCDCDRRDFVAWLQYTRNIVEKDKLVCKYKNGSLISLRYIEDIPNSLEAECIAVAVLISCTVGFIAITILSSLLAVIYYQRWNFNYLLGIGQRNINPYHPLEDCPIEMVYDVYISYERDSIISDDETLHEFVAQKLYPALVNREFKVLIRDELEPGMRLYDQITSNLRRCERVIVLLTKDYCKDFWNVFEFNMAVMEGIYTRRCVIVPVVLDVLNKEDLNEDVYTFLKDYTVAYVRPENLRTVLIPYLIDRLK